MADKVFAIVLTMNRKKLLAECLEGLLRQSRKVDHIIIVDNASNDGTKEMLDERFLRNKKINLLSLKKNAGPAGGFYEGVKKAYSMGADWFWLMDDDSEPMKDCLSELIRADSYLRRQGEEVGLLASTVYNPDGNVINLAKVSRIVDKKTEEQLYPQHLDQGLIRIDTATFVSVMYHRRFVEKRGFPIKELFIYGDDTEYSYRASKSFPSYLVGSSKVLHKKRSGRVQTIRERKEVTQVEQYFHFYRNNIYCLRKYESKVLTISKALVWMTIKPIRSLLSGKLGLLRAKVMMTGTFSGFFFNPKIEIPKS